MPTSKVNKILEGHKQVGKKFIPPLLQLPNIKETSFIRDKIPELIWISGLMNTGVPQIDIIQGLIEFLIRCNKLLDVKFSLSFLSNFNRLSEGDKLKIVQDKEALKFIKVIRKYLYYQNELIDDYPLAFIFESKDEHSKHEMIILLKKDVETLLDRSHVDAVRVQAIFLIEMMATGRLNTNNKICLDELDSIFTDSDSPGARKAASMIRSLLNAGAVIDKPQPEAIKWIETFWNQAHQLDGCE